MNNLEIRALAQKKSVKLYEIANSLGMTDTYFSKKLRYELNSEEKAKIKSIINKLANKQ